MQGIVKLFNFVQVLRGKPLAGLELARIPLEPASAPPPPLDTQLRKITVVETERVRYSVWRREAVNLL
jgi:hypothetical protein